MAVETTNINNYESVVILDPTLTEEDQKAFFTKNKAIVESFEGQINHIDTWGQRYLANKINKLSRGAYFHTTFTANGECVKELERTMKINDKVLRYVHVRLDNRMSIEKHLDRYKDIVLESKKRAEEREAKMQARKAAGNKKFRKPSR